MINILELEKQPLSSLRQIAMDLDIPRSARMKREQLVMRIIQAESEKEGLEIRGGILETATECRLYRSDQSTSRC